MKQNETIQAKHKINGEIVEFPLIATPLKRQSEGEPTRYYPWFKEDEATFENLAGIFGREMLEEYAVDALNREFQMLYFQRSPSKELVKVPRLNEDGTPKLTQDGKPIVAEEKDMTPRLEKFLDFILDENLSGRDINADYCMRKAINISTGIDKKWKDKSQAERTAESMKWMMKAQELMAKALTAKV